MVILAKTKLKDALKEYPELKEFLITLSNKFKKLENPFIFKTFSRWVTFSDIAKIGNLSICELLHKINKKIGKENELLKHAPECIKEEPPKKFDKKPDWILKAKQITLLNVKNRNDFFYYDIIKELKKLKKGEILKIENSFYPAPLVNMLEEEGYELYYEEKDFYTHILYINYKEDKSINWLDKKDKFEILDVRGWKEDPFSVIIKKANETPEGEGFKIIQYFVPSALINMLEPLGYEYYIEKINPLEHHIYFYRKKEEKKRKIKKLKGRIPLVIQSATPVVYPIIMRLLQSRKLMDKIKIEELKIWDKTEKHLGWIINGKADISFSAVAAVANIYQNNIDIKMKAIVIWDNFYLLTRGFKARDFSDLKEKTINLPLIPSAPPYAVTTYLMKRFNYNPEEFKFAFGNPFGRPDEIKDKLVKGEIEAALLREPEASFALFEGKGDIQVSLKYKDLWDKLFPGMGNLPNAGVLFKGELIREYPELISLFLEEVKNAVDYVINNPEESAKIIYDIMGITIEEAKLFLNRVHFEYKESNEVLEPILNYLKVLNEAGYGRKKFKELESLFI